MTAPVAAIQVYRFGVPLVKSYTTTERGAKQYIMEGVASDETPDQQSETIIQKGMDFRPLMDLGIVNWDHLPGPENILGEPLHAAIQAGPQFFVKANLYVEDKERARAAWETAQAMHKAGGRRALGWSVEGAVLGREGRRITRSEVRHLALTHQPVNANTFATICKSMTTTNTPALQLENLDHQMTSVLWGECSGDACYADNGYFYAGPTGALHHLVKCRGMAVDPATLLIKRLINSGITSY